VCVFSFARAPVFIMCVLSVRRCEFFSVPNEQRIIIHTNTRILLEKSTHTHTHSARPCTDSRVVYESTGAGVACAASAGVHEVGH